MNDQTEIADEVLDARPGAMPDAVPASSAEITISLDKVKGEVAAFDKINAGLAKLRKQHPADLVVDVTTPAGMRLAITARAAYRDPRVALERARKSAKAPVLELGRSIDKFAAGIEEQLRIGESNYHDQIKVEEERKAREKKAAEEAEAARVQQIQGRIAFLFTTKPMRLQGAKSATLDAAVGEVEGVEIVEAEFQELTQTAIAAREQAAQTLREMRDAAYDNEQEAERVRTQAEENRRKQEELRKQQEDFEAQQRAHREQVARELAERNAKEEAERRERAAELAAIQKAKDDLAASQRAEADRLAAIERKRLDDEAAERRERQTDLMAIQGWYGEWSATIQSCADGIQKIDATAVSPVLWGDMHQQALDTLAEVRAGLVKRREHLQDQAEAEAAQKKKEAAAAAKIKKLQKLAGMAPAMTLAVRALVQALDDLSDPEDGLPIPPGPELDALQQARRDARALIAEADAE